MSNVLRESKEGEKKKQSEKEKKSRSARNSVLCNVAGG